MKRNNFKRWLSVVLCIVMLAVSIVPVFAEDGSGGPALGITDGARYVQLYRLKRILNFTA